jgi:hypothetical protein
VNKYLLSIHWNLEPLAVLKNLRFPKSEKEATDGHFLKPDGQKPFVF